MVIVHLTQTVASKSIFAYLIYFYVAINPTAFILLFFYFVNPSFPLTLLYIHGIVKSPTFPSVSFSYIITSITTSENKQNVWVGGMHTLTNKCKHTNTKGCLKQ